MARLKVEVKVKANWKDQMLFSIFLLHSFLLKNKILMIMAMFIELFLHVYLI